MCDGTAPQRLVSLFHPPTRVGSAVELEPISDSSQWNWGFHTVGGGVDPRELSTRMLVAGTVLGVGAR